MIRRRFAAVLALLAAAFTIALAIELTVAHFPENLAVVACAMIAIAAGWRGILRRGPMRVISFTIGALALGGAAALLVGEGLVLEVALFVAGLLVALSAGRTAFSLRASLPAAPPPKHPVLLFNPKSGGGKAERFSLADEARKRGIEPIELTKGADLEQLVRDAVAGGADALAMAGGDGSQAVVASVASELNLPYACIPAGTRNHFALDLGVDRDDVVGALDAFVDGGERRVDLAEVNGRVFVNNVSLGLYGEAVQREGYRDSKLRTLLEAAPEVLGPGGEALDLRWRGQGGLEHESAAAILVSNNQYRLGRAGSGTRPRIDEGELGVAVVPAPRDRTGGRRAQGLRNWATPSFRVDSAEAVSAGIDGEAVELDPPLRFGIRPRALRVRIARAHPGASPSAYLPEGSWLSAVALARIATGRDGGRAADATSAT